MQTATPTPPLPQTFLLTAVKGAVVHHFEWRTHAAATASARRLAAAGFATGVLPPGTWGRRSQVSQ